MHYGDGLELDVGFLTEILRAENLKSTVLNVIIGKQFFPRYYRLPSEPGNTTRKACPSAS
ncbi:hypothetical protein NQ317_016419 [Molorchus minor]|uniref:Uncharacterized protein n=1 Tax=Molorchus minor TaxID=1323400 RepID=A0ABQ9K0S8_9CUCU|nr:hypothetical protein NQ317_016419 [Molorchus minor]